MSKKEKGLFETLIISAAKKQIRWCILIALSCGLFYLCFTEITRLDAFKNAGKQDMKNIAAVYIFALGGILALLQILRSASILINPKNNYKVRALSKFGDAENVRRTIDREFQDKENGVIFVYKNLYILKTYIIAKSGLFLWVKKTKDLYWIYDHQEYAKGMSYGPFMAFNFLDGKKFSIRVKTKGDVFTMLQKIPEKLPEVKIFLTDEDERSVKEKMKNYKRNNP